MMDKSVHEIKHAESQCIRAVASGEMKLMFALRKYGLDYPSKGPHSQPYNRMRREIKHAKSVLANKKIEKQSAFLDNRLNPVSLSQPQIITNPIFWQ